LKPQASGKQFEVLFEKIALMRGFYPVRIPNGFQITRDRPLRGFMVKSPFDFILEHDELGIGFLDLKTIATKKFPVALIKPHQMRILDRLSKNNIAGFLVWFRKVDRVVFFRADYAIKSAQLVMEDGLDIGDLSNMDLKKLMSSRNSPDGNTPSEP
jgi:penicillin-binding protein-related factor A (putative recombinase)